MMTLTSVSNQNQLFSFDVKEGASLFDQGFKRDRIMRQNFEKGGTGTEKLFFCRIGRDWDFRDSGQKTGQDGTKPDPAIFFLNFTQSYKAEPKSADSKSKLVTRTGNSGRDIKKINGTRHVPSLLHLCI